VALFVAAPLTEGFLRRKRSANLEFIRLQHERGLALQGLRELEFDHEMGSSVWALDDSDCTIRLPLSCANALTCAS
jgi:hypothetical protein